MDGKGGEGCGREGGEGEGEGRGEEGKGGEGRNHISNSGSKVFHGHLSTWAGHLKICVSVLLHLPQV